MDTLITISIILPGLGILTGLFIFWKNAVIRNTQLTIIVITAVWCTYGISTAAAWGGFFYLGAAIVIANIVFNPMFIISLVYKFKPTILKRLPFIFGVFAIIGFSIHPFVYMNYFRESNVPLVFGIICLFGAFFSWVITKLTLGINSTPFIFSVLSIFICLGIFLTVPKMLATEWVEENEEVLLNLIEERKGNFVLRQPKDLSYRILTFSSQEGYSIDYCNSTYTFKIKGRPDVGFAKHGVPYECHPATSNFLFWKGHSAYNSKRSDLIKLNNNFFIENYLMSF
tara:strand:- start:256 stop:1107 length:852 start_codon:yes stop_codon:yes gene_type:complete